MHTNIIDSYFGEVVICSNKAEHNELGAPGTAVWKINCTIEKKSYFIFTYSVILRSAHFYKLAVT